MSATVEATAPIIDEPGVYDLTDAEYHADPIPGGSLSSSGARKLLPPSCPAVFRHERDHGQPRRAAFDFGHAAHRDVLGVGADIVTIAADDWRSKKAQEARDAAYAAGKVPLLDRDAVRVHDMAAALRQHPLAAALIQPGAGQPEASLFWTDGPTGIWRRARLDWVKDSAGRLLIVDYKTTISASLESISKAIHDYGYHQQAAWYLDGIRDLGLDDRPGFVFVFQEKEPPHLVTVVEPDDLTLQIGSHRNRQAIGIYADCAKTDRWPGYAPDNDIHLIGLPGWAQHRYLQEIA